MRTPRDVERGTGQRASYGEGGPDKAQSRHTLQSHSQSECLLTFFFCSGVQTVSVRTQVQDLGKTIVQPMTLGVLCPLSAVEGQGAHPVSMIILPFMGL